MVGVAMPAATVKSKSWSVKESPLTSIWDSLLHCAVSSTPGHKRQGTTLSCVMAWRGSAFFVGAEPHTPLTCVTPISGSLRVGVAAEQTRLQVLLAASK